MWGVDGSETTVRIALRRFGVTRLTPEFAFVAACCAWPFTPEQSLKIRGRVNNLDWDMVVAIARRHRVEGLLRRTLVEARFHSPPEADADLRTAAERIARTSLFHAAESLRLQAAMQRNGLNVIVLKGTAVELLAYGRLGLKSAKDIDLLVDETEVASSVEALEALGYEPRFPAGVRPPDAKRWVQFGRDLEFMNANGVQVELHWRLDDSPLLIPNINAQSPTEQVRVSADASLTTLRAEEHFAYLCVHGAKHGWSRLKWLCDAFALVNAVGAEDGGERLYLSAVELGAGVCPAQAFLLMEQLFDATPPPSARDAVRRNLIVRWLADTALGVLAAGGGAQELEDQRFRSTPITLSQLFLTGRATNAFVELAHRWRRGPDVELYLSLPPGRRWIYPWLRLRRWARRHSPVH